jgi:hypothetical protein
MYTYLCQRFTQSRKWEGRHYGIFDFRKLKIITILESVSKERENVNVSVEILKASILHESNIIT